MNTHHSMDPKLLIMQASKSGMPLSSFILLILSTNTLRLLLGFSHHDYGVTELNKTWIFPSWDSQANGKSGYT